MYIPMQVDYGVRALVDLAKNQSISPIKASEIANRQNIVPIQWCFINVFEGSVCLVIGCIVGQFA